MERYMKLIQKAKCQRIYFRANKDEGSLIRAITCYCITLPNQWWKKVERLELGLTKREVLLSPGQGVL